MSNYLRESDTASEMEKVYRNLDANTPGVKEEMAVGKFMKLEEKEKDDMVEKMVEDKMNLDNSMVGKKVGRSIAGFVYGSSAEMNLARYSLTKLYSDFSDKKNFTVDNSMAPGKLPDELTIATGYNINSQVFNNVILSWDGCMIYGTHNPNNNTYFVDFVCPSKNQLNYLVSKYMNTFYSGNFYKGKYLKMESGSLIFTPPPVTKLEDVIMDEELKDRFIMNTSGFLLSDSDLRKRSILLHGEPGIGKTTIIRAVSNMLIKEKITCIEISSNFDDCNSKSLEGMIRFVSMHLSPCMIIVEDFDLMAPRRSSMVSFLIGAVLSSFDHLGDVGKKVAVVLTTNRFDSLDAAAIRPCRIDRIMKIERPTKNQIKQLWNSKINLPIDKRILLLENITGSHIEEISSTFKLIKNISKKSDKECLELSVNEVSNSFSVGSTNRIGFEEDNEEDVLKESECTRANITERPDKRYKKLREKESRNS